MGYWVTGPDYHVDLADATCIDVQKLFIPGRGSVQSDIGSDTSIGGAVSPQSFGRPRTAYHGRITFRGEGRYRRILTPGVVHLLAVRLDCDEPGYLYGPYTVAENESDSGKLVLTSVGPFNVATACTDDTGSIVYRRGYVIKH